jgi:hypothetical protein
MKKFSDFLTEARTAAGEQAAKMGLTHAGKGYYADRQGNIVAKSVNGGAKLEKVTPEQAAAVQQQEPEQQQAPEGEEEAAEEGGHIAFTFGRFNPPTVGHEKLLDAVASVPDVAEYRIYPSRVSDGKKNPLEPGYKVGVMKKAYPKHAEQIVNSGNTKNIFDVMQGFAKDGYSEVTLVVGDDRVQEFQGLLEKYNGNLYEFATINVVSAGARDPDAEGVEGMSASKLRAAAAEGDFKTFRSGIPKALKDDEVEKLLGRVRSGMGMSVEVTEDFDLGVNANLWEIAPKLDPVEHRDQFFNENIMKVGAFVQHDDSGVVGRVVYRGPNYVLYIDEQKRKFRSWISSLTEVAGFDFTPMGEMGTPELTKKIAAMTPGQPSLKFSGVKDKLNKRRKSTEGK